MRIGIGYDIHRLVPTQDMRSISIGGISIPCYYQLIAHSDGDVLLHAAVDACLGALALGDIGQWFPDNKAENKNRLSSEFIKEVLNHIDKMGWKPVQMDSIVFLEEPKLSPHIDSIRENLAKLLGVELSMVSVKAKTNEKIGPIGEKHAIAGQVLMMLEKKNGA